VFKLHGSYQQQNRDLQVSTNIPNKISTHISANISSIISTTISTTFSTLGHNTPDTSHATVPRKPAARNPSFQAPQGVPKKRPPVVYPLVPPRSVESHQLSETRSFSAPKSTDMYRNSSISTDTYRNPSIST